MSTNLFRLMGELDDADTQAVINFINGGCKLPEEEPMITFADNAEMHHAAAILQTLMPIIQNDSDLTMVVEILGTFRIGNGTLQPQAHIRDRLSKLQLGENVAEVVNRFQATTTPAHLPAPAKDPKPTEERHVEPGDTVAIGATRVVKTKRERRSIRIPRPSLLPQPSHRQ